MAESLLPVGMKFTKRFWSTEDIKRRVDYTICVNVSEGNLQYQIKVSLFLEIFSKLIFFKGKRLKLRLVSKSSRWAGQAIHQCQQNSRW